MKNIEKGENNQAFTISKGDISDSSSKYVTSDDSKHQKQVDHNYNQENSTISMFISFIFNYVQVFISQTVIAKQKRRCFQKVSGNLTCQSLRASLSLNFELNCLFLN